MSPPPLPELTAKGYEPPKNIQFSVFLDNRVGKLGDLVAVFQDQPLVLAGFCVIDAADHAVVRLLTSNADLAENLLKRHNMPFSQDEVLVIESTPDRSLADLCHSLLQAEVNIHFAYPLLVRPRGSPAVVLHTDDMTFVGQLLRRKLFTLLAQNDLGDNASRGRPEGWSAN